MTELVKYLTKNFDTDELVQKLRFVADRNVLSLIDKDIAKKFNLFKSQYINKLYEAYKLKRELENDELIEKASEQSRTQLIDNLNGGCDPK